MRISSKIHIILAILAFLFSAVLKGQQQVELVPYSIIPLDPIPDCRLELGIRLIHPYTVEQLPEPQKDETYKIIYDRIAFEISNPDKEMGLFQIDDRFYHLIRIPYTAASGDEIELERRGM